jgi:hypothetical protein
LPLTFRNTVNAEPNVTFSAAREVFVPGTGLATTVTVKFWPPKGTRGVVDRDTWLHVSWEPPKGTTELQFALAHPTLESEVS